MTHIRSLILALVLSAGLAPAFAQAPPPVPALPDTERRTSYAITASTCACAVGFQLYQDGTDVANWLKVYINGVEIQQSGNWTITSPSGSISTLPRPITNAVLTFTTAQTGTVQIVGAQRPRRLSEFGENRGVAARDLNQALNGIEAQLREMWDRQFRTVQAPPGETLSMLPPLAGRASMGACFDSGGNLAPCLSAGSGTFVAGNGINFTGTGPTTISTATYSAGNGITFTGTNPTTISVSPTSGTPIVPTRAIAATLDLSAYDVIQTGGYSIPGDGGHATFKKIGATPFIDSFITTFTITGGSGYTNGGAYYGNLFSVGTKPFAIGTVVVAGGAFTAVDISGTPGGQCAVGDFLSFVVSAAAVGGVNGGMPAGGTGGGITVTGCSSPLGSFTDAVGNRFQIVTPTGANVLQFGAKGDWNGTDAGATDNFNAFQAAYWYAGFKSSTSFDSGGFWGGRVTVPQGAYMVCGTGLKPLILSEGVWSVGVSPNASSVKFCSAWDAGTTQLELGDPNWHFACFNNSVWSMQFRSDSGTAYMIHSNCTQDFGGLYQTYIYSNGSSARPCLHYEKGYGGASTFVVRDLSCSANSNSPQILIGNTIASGMNVGSTMVELTNLVMGGNSGPTGNHQTAHALTIHGGFVNVNRFHFEATGGGIRVAVGATGNGETITINNVNGGGLPVHAPCSGMITLDGINIPGNTVISQVQTSGTCTSVVENGQAGGVNYNLAIRQPAYFSPNYTSF
jgi:hypothetical protein